MITFKNAGLAGPHYSSIKVDGSGPSTEITIRHSGEDDVVLNFEQVKLLSEKLTAWVKKNALTKPRSIPLIVGRSL